MAVPVTSGLVGHWDADALTGLADDETFATWPDESGEGNDVTGGSATYKTGVLNGLPAVRFDGSNQWYGATLGSSITGGRTVFALVELPPNDSTIHGWVAGGTTDEVGLCMIKWSDDDRFILGYKTGGGDFFEVFDASMVGATGIMTLQLVPSGTDLVRFAGTELDSGSLDSTDLTAIKVGSSEAAGRFHLGDVFEVLLYNRALNSTEIGQVEDYLNDKWLGAGGTTPTASGVVEAIGELSATGHVTLSASGTVEAEGQLVATGHIQPKAFGVVSAEGELAATGHVDKNASGTVEAEGELSATGHTTPKASGTVSAVGELSATGSAPSIIPEASGTVEAEASLSATGHKTPKASGVISGQGSLEATGHRTAKAAGTVEAVGFLEGVGYLTPLASGVIEAVGVLVGVGSVPAQTFWQSNSVGYTSDPVAYTRADPDAAPPW